MNFIILTLQLVQKTLKKIKIDIPLSFLWAVSLTCIQLFCKLEFTLIMGMWFMLFLVLAYRWLGENYALFWRNLFFYFRNRRILVDYVWQWAIFLAPLFLPSAHAYNISLYDLFPSLAEEFKPDQYNIDMYNNSNVYYMGNSTLARTARMVFEPLYQVKILLISYLYSFLGMFMVILTVVCILYRVEVYRCARILYLTFCPPPPDPNRFNCFVCTNDRLNEDLVPCFACNPAGNNICILCYNQQVGNALGRCPFCRVAIIPAARPDLIPLGQNPLSLAHPVERSMEAFRRRAFPANPPFIFQEVGTFMPLNRETRTIRPENFAVYTLELNLFRNLDQYERNYGLLPLSVEQRETQTYFTTSVEVVLVPEFLALVRSRFSLLSGGRTLDNLHLLRVYMEQLLMHVDVSSEVYSQLATFTPLVAYQDRDYVEVRATTRRHDNNIYYMHYVWIVLKIWSSILMINTFFSLRSWIWSDTYLDLIVFILRTMRGDAVSAGLVSLVMTLTLLVYKLLTPVWQRLAPDRIQ
jgi:hypothetical protein